MNRSQTPPSSLLAPQPPAADLPVGHRRRTLIAAAGAALLSACGGGGSGSGGGSDTTPSAPPPAAGPTPAPPAAGPTPAPSPAPSPSPGPAPAPSPTPAPAPTPLVKRGIAYNLSDAADFSALSGPVGWWYNWALQPDAAVRATPSIAKAMSHVPMLWNFNFDIATVVAELKARPTVQHLLVLNEPNLKNEANMTPQEAAALWPRYEAVASQTGVQIVGPAMTWGTMTGYEDPVAWLDAFYAAYRANNGGRDPQIDALAFHWYDYGLNEQLDRLKKYAKPFWVTEMANWHNGDGKAEVTTSARQIEEMSKMVNVCETRADVVRYAWFIGRMSPDPHFTSLLAGPGVLTPVGQSYLQQPTA